MFVRRIQFRIRKKNRTDLFELSFGQSVLFISDSKLTQILNSQSIVVPTNSILFFLEFRPAKKLRIPVYLNLPTETKQFIVNNQLVNEKANPTAGFGVQYCFMKFPIGEKSKLEAEAGPLAGFLTSKQGHFAFAPLVAGRLRFVKNKDFVMYVGGTYAFGLNNWGLLYGTGYVF